jgi:thiamine biosynthesis protein ThiS
MTHSTTQTIQIVVNGEGRAIPQGLTVEMVLREIGVEPERVAVELNREIVRKPHWATTPVEDGARLEIVQFVGGG